MLSGYPHLQQGTVVIEIQEVLEQIPPDADVIEGHAHPSTGQRVPHVVGVAQEEHACKGASVRPPYPHTHTHILISLA